MTSPRVWLSRIAGFLRGARAESAFREEIETHLDLLTDEFVAKGLPPADARLAARRAFGGVDQVRARHRHERGLPLFDALLQDLRFACRLVVKEPWFTAAAIAGLTLGIAGATTVFTIVSSMDRRTLPLDDPEQVVAVRRLDRNSRVRGVSFEQFQSWQRGASGLVALAASRNESMNLADDWGHAPERFGGTYVTANAFSVLGIQPVLGRDLGEPDDRPGAPPVMLLGHDVWAARYGSDPSVVGRTVRVNGMPTTVVGIMPPGFRFPFQSDLWLPLQALPERTTSRSGNAGLSVFGRLSPDATPGQAASAVAAISSTWTPSPGAAPLRDVVIPFHESFFGNNGPVGLMLVSGGALFVLLIACVNVSALMIARAESRMPEVGMRAALGAGRARLIAQLLVEGLVLSVPAALLALGLSAAAVGAFAREATAVGMPYWVRFGFDGRVFAFVAALGLVSPWLFGLAPALQLSRAAMGAAVQQAGRGVPGLSAHHLAGILLVGELALTTTLLGGAAVLARGTLTLYRADRIVDLDRLWTLRIELPPRDYPTFERQQQFFSRLESRFAGVAGLSGAALTTAVPFAAAADRLMELDEGDDRPRGEWPAVTTVGVTTSYFETLGLGLQRGRMFGAADGPVAVVNERFVDQYSPAMDPIGRRLRLHGPRDSGEAPLDLTIVGVAPSVRQRPMSDVLPVAYVPFAAMRPTSAAVLARSASEAPSFAPALQVEVQAIDRDLPLYGLQPLERISQFSRWEVRVTSALAVIFAAIATLLSALGLYAVTAYGVAQRTQEVGVRMALGAARSQVVGLFVRAAARRLLAGLFIGALGALGVTMLLRGVVVRAGEASYGLLVATGALLALVALAATVIPARHAARVDPMTALRRT